MRRYSVVVLMGFLALAVSALTYAAGGGAPAGNQGRLKQITTKDQTKEFSEQFLRAMGTGRPYDAFAMIKTMMPDLEADIEQSRQSAEQIFDRIRPSYGKPVGYELVSTKSLGESIVRYDYLYKFDRNALHFRVQYYKPTANKPWIPTFIGFQEDLTVLFDEAGK